MASTSANNRDVGNYVQFDNVDVTSSDTLTITVSPESPLATEIPAVSAIQLVQVVPVLSVSRNGLNITISWPNAAYGYVLEVSSVLGSGASWSLVNGTPNPITQAGSAGVTASGNRFYRLRKL
jgi:hypothetical protein